MIEGRDVENPPDARRKKSLFELRRKMFPLHVDPYDYYADPQYILSTIKEHQESGVDFIKYLGDRPYRTPKFQRLYRKTKAQFNDPICLYAVIEMLIRSFRGHYIRPQYLTPRLKNEYPLYFWSNTIVGRILSGIQKACSEDYPEFGRDEFPISRGRDNISTYYVIDPKGSDEGLLWLVRVRDYVLDLAESLMTRESSGDFRDQEPLPDIHESRVFESCNLRDDELYKASWGDPQWTRLRNSKTVNTRDPLA